MEQAIDVKPELRNSNIPKERFEWVFKLSITSTIASASGCTSSTNHRTTSAKSLAVRRSVTGTARHPSSGSDTMNNLVALWVEGFKKSYPGVREGIEGKGSASAPPVRLFSVSPTAPTVSERPVKVPSRIT